MSMKKYLSKKWIRILSCILCTISVIGLAAAGICSSCYAQMGSYTQGYTKGAEAIANNYALYAYELLIEQGNEQELTKFLEENGLYCKIQKVKADASTEEAQQIYTYGDVNTKWDYSIEVVEGSSYNYSIESMWSALQQGTWFNSTDYWVKFPITGFVFDGVSGIFYYETEIGYFPIEYIYIYLEDNSYMDYKLKRINGQLCYYNGYYNFVLDSEDLESWEYLDTGNQHLYLWKEKGMDEWDSVQYIADLAAIDNRIYYEDYSVSDFDSSISYYEIRDMDNYQIYISRSNTETPNLFSEWENTLSVFYIFYHRMPLMLGICAVFLCVGLALLFSSSYSQEQQLGRLQKIPFGIYSISIMTFQAVFILLMEETAGCILESYIQPEAGYTLFVIWVVLTIYFAFVYLQNFIDRLRSRCFWRYSEVHYVAKFGKWLWKKSMYPVQFFISIIKEDVSFFWKGVGIFAAIAFLEFSILLTNMYNPQGLCVWFILIKLIEMPLGIYLLIQMRTLQEGAKRIASGDLFHPIDTSRMLWEFKKHGDYLNNVSESIQLAVNEQMKSERFKTELITNVSHDIKTPLTSIINYVDFIKKENITDEKLCEYVEVLDRQSARLKKLIEDLMEASKASTGNLKVTLEECDMEVLLTQVIGEFEEKLESNQLQVIVDKPEHPVFIMADGRHMWRVLDNLLGNVCKYALTGTRVYISLKQEGEQVIIVFKNISKAPLNIPSEELLSRFVRGDSSRNTEGSGLGLSIAQSLTELMHGTMKLNIDGDLFKVTLQFLAIHK